MTTPADILWEEIKSLKALKRIHVYIELEWFPVNSNVHITDLTFAEHGKHRALRTLCGFYVHVHDTVPGQVTSVVTALHEYPPETHKVCPACNQVIADAFKRKFL